MEQDLREAKASELYFTCQGTEAKSSHPTQNSSILDSKSSLKSKRRRNVDSKELFKQSVSTIIRNCENYQGDKELLCRLNQHRNQIANKQKEAVMNKSREIQKINTLNRCQLAVSSRKNTSAVKFI